MIIRSAKFIKSSPSLRDCPAPDKAEFGFIGRSNVGKSSLINMLTGFQKLAKTSANPGKTRTINHFLVNDSWYLVDLPGYGYAKISASQRDKWIKETENFILKRDTLLCLFVLIDSRHKPQASDLHFMEFLGLNEVPFARIFTKSDKISLNTIQNSIREYDRIMLEAWESLPVTFITSAVDSKGRDEILGYIEETVNNFSKGG